MTQSNNTPPSDHPPRPANDNSVDGPVGRSMTPKAPGRRHPIPIKPERARDEVGRLPGAVYCRYSTPAAADRKAGEKQIEVACEYARLFGFQTVRES